MRVYIRNPILFNNMFSFARIQALGFADNCSRFNSVCLASNTDLEDYANTSSLLQTVMISIFIVMIGGSNALVILTFLVDKSLRIQSNFFLLNLSISDFLIGTVSLPFYMVNYVLNGKWILGRSVCKLWIVLDYVLFQSSLYNIVLISYDRFLSVTRAASYRAEQNRTKPAFIKMVAVWSLAFLLYGPMITCWEYVAGYTNIPDGECNPEFFYIRYYRLGSVAVDVFIPLAAIVYFDLSIYCNIRARTRNKAMQTATASAKTERKWTFEQTEINLSTQEIRSVSSTSDQCKIITRRNFINSSIRKIRLLCSALHSNKTVGVVFTISQSNLKNSRLAADKNIAKSLSIIVCTFCVCWIPFFGVMVIREIFGHDSIPLVCNVLIPLLRER
ncbi:histamine H3 receptor-like [Pleurodeles waltl]|uniref:histamine H3 receptor-like n=1 Tax=Pleurodeles waltl TaxID=8319 RepID=UPI0037095323